MAPTGRREELRKSMLAAAYLRHERFCDLSSAWRDGVLGGACFSANVAANLLAAAPSVSVLAPPLDQEGSVGEIWRAGASPVSGRQGPISYRHDDNILFGCCAVDEAEFADDDPATVGTALQRATEYTYRSILALIDELQFPHLLRVWNYVAGINRESDGIERYRQFNAGRQAGFAAGSRPTHGNVPPASALGVQGGPLTVYFLAGKLAPLIIENPRQVSAYHYPPEYGTRSPTFSRAGLFRLGDQEVLFVSGTASIVGHRSVHPGDVAAQTRESLANIEAVLGEANRHSRQHHFTLADLHYKVYVRHARDLDVVRSELRRAAGERINAVYLQADICRSELLVEIEASCGHPMEIV
jgi:chorismate lyase/3-hydroxybenzoate synthase